MAGKNRILARMLDRLFASLVNGPSLNARPHASRQRVDLTHVARLGDLLARGRPAATARAERAA